MKHEELVRAAASELRRQHPQMHDVELHRIDGRVTIIAIFTKGVEVNVNRLVEAVLDELYGGFGALGEIEP